MLKFMDLCVCLSAGQKKKNHRDLIFGNGINLDLKIIFLLDF